MLLKPRHTPRLCFFMAAAPVAVEYQGHGGGIQADKRNNIMYHWRPLWQKNCILMRVNI